MGEMVIRSVNITGNELLEIKETCIYSENEEKSTQYEQKAVIETPVSFLRGPIETFAMTVHETNAKKGLSAMKKICSVSDASKILQILNWRLDTILLLNELKSIRMKDI